GTRGDMSLIGPRPERPEFVGPLQAQVPGYADRLKVRPGVTGLAQIQLPPDTGIESVRAKVVLDLYYVHHRSLSLDLRILFGTALHVVGLPFAAVRVIARLPKLVHRLPEPGTIAPPGVTKAAPAEVFPTQTQPA